MQSGYFPTMDLAGNRSGKWIRDHSEQPETVGAASRLRMKEIAENELLSLLQLLMAELWLLSTLIPEEKS